MSDTNIFPDSAKRKRRNSPAITFEQLLAGLDAKKSGNQWMARCPAHDDSSPSLSIDCRDGTLFLHDFSGKCQFSAIVEALDRRGLWPIELPDDVAPVTPSPLPSPGEFPPGFREFDAKLITARPTGIVGRYLRERRLAIEELQDLQQHPKAYHQPSDSSWPAMVAAIREPDGNLRSLHRTFLNHLKPAKAPIDPQRMLWGGISPKGCAIHLSPPAERMLLSEGIESTASAMKLLRLPGWAAISAGNLRQVILPEMVKDIVIAADNDDAGYHAAVTAAHRFKREGRSVTIRRPANCKDFNDLLMREVRYA
jgi:hypothetical protein